MKEFLKYTIREIEEIEKKTGIKVLAPLALQSLSFFCWYYLSHHFYTLGFSEDVILDKYDKYIPLHQKDFFEVLEDESITRIHRLMPKEHGKSTIASVAFPLWEICKNPDIRIILVSVTGDEKAVSVKCLRKIKFNLEKNEKLIRDFKVIIGAVEYPLKPESPEAWSLHQIIVNRPKSYEGDPTVLAIGSGSALQGARSDIIVADDIVDYERNSYTIKARQKLSRWYNEDLMGTLMPDGRLVFVGTKKTKGDLHSDVQSKKSYNCGTFRAILNKEKKKVLWTQMWPWKKLMERKLDIGSIAFARDYQNEVQSEEETKFPLAWLEACRDAEIYRYGRNYIREDYLTIIQVWDLGAAADAKEARRKDTDFSVCMTLGLRKDRVRVVLDMFRTRGLSLGKLLVRIDLEYKKHTPDTVIIESNAFQKIIATSRPQGEKIIVEIEDKKYELDGKIPIKPHNTKKSEKADLFQGAMVLSPKIEFGFYRFAYNDIRSRGLTDIIFEELYYFPNGEHDDTLLALFIGELTFRRYEKKHKLGKVVSMQEYQEKKPTRRAFTKKQSKKTNFIEEMKPLRSNFKREMRSFL